MRGGSTRKEGREGGREERERGREERQDREEERAAVPNNLLILIGVTTRHKSGGRPRRLQLVITPLQDLRGASTVFVVAATAC